MSWVDACAADFETGELRDVVIGNLHLGVTHAGDTWHAFEVWCTHAECPLTDGWREGAAVRCACHGALFDLETGEPLEGPAEEPVRIFSSREVAGRVEVLLPATDT